ncbi:MAG: hypothetical protein AAGN82_25530 [Myxococcota bacterium]
MTEASKAGVALLDRIEASRFLGPEFLLWLWFESDRGGGRVAVAEDAFIELWFEDALTLTDAATEVRLKAPTPTATPEAFEAVRQGKRPQVAKLRLTEGTQSWVFTYRAETAGWSGVTVPTEFAGDEEEGFFERMRLLEALEARWAELWARFFALRTSCAWSRRVLPELRAWVTRGGPS